jgi:hypothetical protein
MDKENIFIELMLGNETGMGVEIRNQVQVNAYIFHFTSVKS